MDRGIPTAISMPAIRTLALHTHAPGVFDATARFRVGEEIVMSSGIEFPTQQSRMANRHGRARRQGLPLSSGIESIPPDSAKTCTVSCHSRGGTVEGPETAPMRCTTPPVLSQDSSPR